MTSPALDYFTENLPRRPYHTDELVCGLRIDKVAKAVFARYIQHNPPHAMYWLVFDVDRMGAAIDWSDVNAPAPNITVKNLANGHAHLFYGLTTAVRTAPDGSIKALKYAAAIELGLRDRLQSDIGYAGLISKNPLNKHWQVHEWRSELYSLDELADYVTFEPSERTDAPRIDSEYGLGRNCHLFDKTRRWAYKAIRQGWPDFVQWKDAVIQRVEMYNVQLPVPLCQRECACIGNSIAKWTHKRFTESGFEQYVADTHTPEIQAERGRRGGKKNRSEVQATKGRKGGIAKGEANSSKREQALQMLAHGITQKTVAEQLGITTRTLRNWKSGK
ncbi:replication initiation protein [Salmonella enterica subsp. enterica serovar 1,4,[5],12:i:-]|uniref:Plasmid replication protein n=1 Tax=Salmonella enterica TaxID=28901 RepID=A0A5U2GCX5_SALER|nr:plasmid replication protein [Salmonella enterica]EGI0920671.1 plasmid replication protein [Salmonella enterica]EGK8384845.1 plasmid replication protein [Salmonella enterica]EJP9297531.1 replication initiation protein [Salmonella enterica]